MTSCVSEEVVSGLDNDVCDPRLGIGILEGDDAVSWPDGGPGSDHEEEGEPRGGTHDDPGEGLPGGA